MNLGPLPHLLIVNPHHSPLDVDQEPVLPSCSNDVGGEARYVVGVGKGVVLPVLAREQDGTTSLDLDDRAVTESHHAD
jgi:hypothetical protein